MTHEQKLVVKTAVNWWRRKRPAQWTVGEHINSATYNCTGLEDHELARAVALYVKSLPILERGGL